MDGMGRLYENAESVGGFEERRDEANFGSALPCCLCRSRIRGSGGNRAKHISNSESSLRPVISAALERTDHINYFGRTSIVLKRACGFGHALIILRYMAPNVVAPFLILLTAFVG